MKLTLAFLTLSNISDIESPKNGGYPDKRMYVITPILHLHTSPKRESVGNHAHPAMFVAYISTLESYGSFFTISGARYLK
jgi:hypothetical protein